MPMSGKAGRPAGTTGFKKAQLAAMKDPSQQSMTNFCVKIKSIAPVIRANQGNVIINVIAGGHAVPDGRD